MQPDSPLTTSHFCSRSGEARAHPGPPGHPTEVNVMSTTIRNTITAVSLSAVVAAAALAGFALANDDTATAVTITDTKSGSTSPPGAKPATARPATAESAIDATGALLDAHQMPRVNEVQSWTVAGGEASFVGFGHDDLGATGTVRRNFEMAGGKATNVVLTFADEASAKAAYDDFITSEKADLEAGLPTGGELLYGPGERIAVEVGDGAQAAFSSIIYKDDPALEEGWFEWAGAVQLGDSVSVIAWRVGGNDASYDIDPTIASLHAAHTALAR